MKKRKRSIYAIIMIAMLSMSCNNSGNPSSSHHSSSDTSQNEVNQNESTKNEVSENIEKVLNVSFKTKLVEWGGDGKWHDMYKNDNGSYWINYADPFKIILTGNYSDLNIRIKSSSGSTILEETHVKIPDSGEYILSNDQMIGENETNFHIEIKAQDKIIFKGDIESVPGGE